jgi:hypothetical protein
MEIVEEYMLTVDFHRDPQDSSVAPVPVAYMYNARGIMEPQSSPFHQHGSEATALSPLDKATFDHWFGRADFLR